MSEQMARRISYSAGFIGSIVVLLGSLFTALNYRGGMGEAYSIFNHFVSELGNTQYSEWCLLFNITLILGALSLGVFWFFLAESVENPLRKRLKIVGVIGSVGGMLVGFFPMNLFSIHYWFASIFFLMSALYVGMFTVHLWRTPQSNFPRWLIYAALPTLISVVTFLIIGTINLFRGQNTLNVAINERPEFLINAFTEWTTILGMIFWVLCVSFYLRSAK